MIVLLGFGTSHRRGQIGWSDREKLRRVIDACEPDATVDGASPSGGADDVLHEEACEFFLSRGVSMERARRCPMEIAKDGQHRSRFMNRNARMYREHRPSLAVGAITGKVGSPLSAGSAHMLGICLAGIPAERVPPCPVVVLRDDGLEPYAGLAIAKAQLLRLWQVTRDERLLSPGKGLAALIAGEAPKDAVLTSLRYAATGSRWAPWIEAVETTVRSVER